jgi:two-component system sensor histidine kinase UhpB
VHDALKIHVFRIVQEALNNIIRHAHPTNVWVRLDRCETGLRLTIRDDGVGFDAAEMGNAGRGLGLSSMRQRASLYSGTLTIESEHGRGTTICAIWPNPIAGMALTADEG